MNERMAELMRYRGELLARIAAQRDEMTEIGWRLQTPLSLADRGVAAVRYLLNNPLLIIGVTALFVIRRRGVVALMLGAWKGYRYFTSIAAQLPLRG